MKTIFLTKANKDGYTLLARVGDDSRVSEYIVAYGYESQELGWVSGTYFGQDLDSAYKYYQLNENDKVIIEDGVIK